MIEATSRSPADEEGRDGLAAVSVAERRLSADAAQWLSLGLVAGAAILADQVTKHLVSSQLAVGEEVQVVGTVFHPPRPQLGDRVRPLRPRDRDRDRAHARSR